MLRLLDLFSGIGGFSLGLESTGYFQTIAFCEKDEFCQKVLKKHWKDIPIESEIRNVKGTNYKADIITGGFPCQPFSIAGKRKGTDDDRYLWDETIRVIKETKPRWFIGENVDGIINIQDGMVLRQVQNDLEEEGFQVQSLVIPASSIGAWHQRKRVWILAYSEHNGSHQQKRNETLKSSNQQKEWVFIRDDQQYVSNSECIKLNGCDDASRARGEELQRMDSNKERNGNKVWSETERCSEQDRDDVSHTKIKGSQGHGLSTHVETEYGQNFTKGSFKKQHTWWETQSRICGVPHGVSFELDKTRKHRIKSLGNSIVPQIVRQLGLAIMEAENDNI